MYTTGLVWRYSRGQASAGRPMLGHENSAKPILSCTSIALMTSDHLSGTQRPAWGLQGDYFDTHGFGVGGRRQALRRLFRFGRNIRLGRRIRHFVVLRSTRACGEHSDDAGDVNFTGTPKGLPRLSNDSLPGHRLTQTRSRESTNTCRCSNQRRLCGPLGRSLRFESRRD